MTNSIAKMSRIEQRLKNQKKRDPKPNLLGIKLSDYTMKLLLQRAAEKNIKKPSSYARHIIENHLNYSEEKSLKQAINNIAADNDFIKNNLQLFMNAFMFFIQSHFAVHPDIPDLEEKKERADAAERKSKDFLRIVLSNDIKSGGLTVEKLIANSNERRKTRFEN